MSARALLLAFVLCGCASAPQPVGNEGGFASSAVPSLPSPPWPRIASNQLRAKEPLLRRCFAEEVHRVEDRAAAGAYRHGEKVPHLAGRLVLAVPVEADGTVMAARIEDDTLRNAAVDRCLVAAAKKLRFPPPPEGEPVELAVPFSFSVSGPAKQGK